MAYNIDGKNFSQKQTFCGLEQDPESPENILCIVNLA